LLFSFIYTSKIHYYGNLWVSQSLHSRPADLYLEDLMTWPIV